MFARFTSLFNNTNVALVPFNPAWPNQTGYFNGLVNGPAAPALASGEAVKSVDPKGRKIIVVGTPAGNVAVFQHHTYPGLLIKQVAHDARKLFPQLEGCGVIDETFFDLLFGNKAKAITTFAGGEGYDWGAEAAAPVASPEGVVEVAATPWYKSVSALAKIGTGAAVVGAAAYYGWKFFASAATAELSEVVHAAKAQAS